MQNVTLPVSCTKCTSGWEVMPKAGLTLLVGSSSNWQAAAGPQLFTTCSFFRCNTSDRARTWGVRGSRVWMMGSELMRDTNLV